eukprot:Gb_22449 [translate_table: standard]
MGKKLPYFLMEYLWLLPI